MAETTRIDAKGLKCPMPVIKLQQQTRKSNAGDHLLIECTDPGAEKDITSWCKVNRHKVIHVQPTETGCTIEIEVHSS
ncbi:sulfurtransferase TusA family protein [Hydrogenovibrio sp. 3SP14C1]|uniref:sulfurtransferase TusA family protein n=1 Tax=Hydrogenovibrio sp. 3SP14C1 TaxID=3038774 RepID=UPI00241686B7|nr:sulfurtransferase TusA family protein [Hydrogenovibrio sp. 3SP14C1]MDG4812061.1 sulfurtransferase TusA family protein [Hydrogenovibrio sp. 3SP14C1]